MAGRAITIFRPPVPVLQAPRRPAHPPAPAAPQAQAVLWPYPAATILWPIKTEPWPEMPWKAFLFRRI